MFVCGLQSKAAYIKLLTPFHAAYNQGRISIKGRYQSNKCGNSDYFYAGPYAPSLRWIIFVN